MDSPNVRMLDDQDGQDFDGLEQGQPYDGEGDYGYEEEEDEEEDDDEDEVKKCKPVGITLGQRSAFAPRRRPPLPPEPFAAQAPTLSLQRRTSFQNRGRIGLWVRDIYGTPTPTPTPTPTLNPDARP